MGVEGAYRQVIHEIVEILAEAFLHGGFEECWEDEDREKQTVGREESLLPAKIRQKRPHVLPNLKFSNRIN